MIPSDFLPAHGGQLRELASAFNIPESSLVDFSASIHPLPPSDALVTSLCDAIRARKILTTYPDLHYSALKHAIAEYAHVAVPALAIGNGVMPLLEAAVRALGLRKCLIALPGFSGYRSILAACGTQSCALTGEYGGGFLIDPDRVIAELKATGAQAVLLANPQSPSGLVMTGEKLARLHGEASALGVTTIVDEAFIDYVPNESLCKTAVESRRLVVLRSLTKFFGMPGLRVAYVITHPEIRAAIEACVPAWPVDSIAAEAACLALQNEASIVATREINRRERRWLEDRLDALRLRVFPSAANYLMVRTNEDRGGLALWRRLVVEHGVVIRSCANFEGLNEHYFRIGVRTHPENQLLVKALRDVLRSSASPATR
jgi:threonine-phosphate decarboxylase